MTAKWGACAILALCLALLVGCRTPVPNVKPPTTKENLVDPPQDTRYDSPGYPKQAYDKMVDPIQEDFNAKTAPGVMPTRGAMTPGGMGGLPGRP